MPTTPSLTTAHILTLSCPDRPGIVHAVSTALLEVGSNITENAQFSDPGTGLFCLRTEFDAEVDEPGAVAAVIERHLGDADATITVRRAADRPKVMVLVSKADHCLVDLLYRWKSGGLKIDLVAVVSNHTDCAEVAARYDVPFHYLPVAAETKAAQEAQLVQLIERYDTDLVVLARYMQILSNELCRVLEGRAINIHHSFLPGFKGARPYHQAFERGVKLVGATAHFVTSDLDEGPIIEQDVARVTHAHTPQHLVELGQDTERLVLSRAVKYWAEDRVLLVGRKTVVFP